MDIKFRAWYLGKMINNCAVVNGCLAIEENFKPEHDHVYTDENGRNYYSDWSKYNYYPMAKLMQFTGMTDKNGVDIYEGDILKVCDYYMTPTIHEVQWGGNDYPAFTLSPEIGFESNCFSHIAANGDISIEVIGNIYQNPELLTA